MGLRIIRRFLALAAVVALLAGCEVKVQQIGAPYAVEVVPVGGGGTEPDVVGDGSLEVPQHVESELERQVMNAEIAANVAHLALGGELSAQSVESVRFGWPLRPAVTLADPGYHGVSGFVDHDPVYGALLDYTCGWRTYDLVGYNHKGTDFYTTPFPWLKMDTDQVAIVAAAPGTIIYRHDGEYDRNCAMTGALSNSVAIRHADGSQARYLHMKRGSVTPKQVGETVAEGEYLGIVGSSGSSTGPHLHFEVWNAANQVLDPFTGSCNVSPSMWASQPPYYDSGILAVHTGTALPVRPACPGQETPNTSDDFSPGDEVTFITYYRDLLKGQESTHEVTRPDGSVFKAWTYTASAAFRSASYSYAKATLDEGAPAGTWRYEVTFEGETFATSFNVGDPTSIRVTLPNGGQLWAPGTTRGIAWEDNLGGNVRIDLYLDGSYFRTLFASTPSDGVELWYIPEDVPPDYRYTVRVTNPLNPALYDESDATFVITVAPVAHMFATPTAGESPLTVQFTDATTGVVDTCLWDFGDGTTSTERHPQHTYTAPGTYTVSLSVWGPGGTDALTQTDLIEVTLPPLDARFSAHPLLGTPPLTVTFADLTVGPTVQSWLWTFSDGGMSTLQHPTHVFSPTGTYTATLTVTAGGEVASTSGRLYVVDEVWPAYLPVVSRE